MKFAKPVVLLTMLALACVGPTHTKNNEFTLPDNVLEELGLAHKE